MTVKSSVTRPASGSIRCFEITSNYLEHFLFSETTRLPFIVTIEVDIKFNESDKESALYLSLVADVKREVSQ